MNEMAVLREQLVDYVSGAIEIKEFQEWFVPFYWDLPSSADLDAIAVSRKILGRLAEFGNGARNEPSLRKELADALLPFLKVGMNQAGTNQEAQSVAESEFPFDVVSASAA